MPKQHHFGLAAIVVVASSLLTVGNHTQPDSSYCIRYIRDLTSDDNAVITNDNATVNAGQAFFKGWRIENCGTNSLVGFQARRTFTAGSENERIEPNVFDIPDIPPGEQRDIVAQLSAPTQPGTHIAVFQPTLDAAAAPEWRTYHGTLLAVQITVISP